MITCECECGNNLERTNNDVTLSGKDVILRTRTACCSCQAVFEAGSRLPLSNLDQARAEVEKQLTIFDIQPDKAQTIDDFF